MVFTAPPWVPALLSIIPDNVSIGDFMYSDEYRHQAIESSRSPFTCALNGCSYTISDVKKRVEDLARGLAAALRWDPDRGSEWDKIACIFSENTVNYVPVMHAVHRLGGLVTPASAAFNASELRYQLQTSKASVLFLSEATLSVGLNAAHQSGLPPENIFILDDLTNNKHKVHKSLQELIKLGCRLPALPLVRWVKGQGIRQVAFICFSSGTSGLPKAVMISHHNVIANVVQIATNESSGRKLPEDATRVVLGSLPFSHIYGIVVISHLSLWRGDEVIVLPKHDLRSMLKTIQKFRIQLLYLVPPIIVQMLRDKATCANYDLKSVSLVLSGAAPLGPEVVKAANTIWPTWKIGQGYGLTESSTGISGTTEDDVMVGSCGTILPLTSCKIVDRYGIEILEPEQRGELLVQSPSICLGYLHNESATAETFIWDDHGRWLRTGDEALIRKSMRGSDHLVIVDRIKELIKVKGNQVAPAELEEHLLAHDLVADCAVIPVPEEYAGEVPKAFVVRSKAAELMDEKTLSSILCRHVEDHKSRYKWLGGGVEFVEAIPKSPSGKILRRLLRDQDKETNRKRESKL